MLSPFPLSPAATLNLGEKSIEKIVHIPVHNLLVISTAELKVHVYKVQEGAEFIPLHTFEKHFRSITGLIYLSDDILCSLDIGGNFFTWEARTNKVLDTKKVLEVISAPLTKLDATQFAAGTETGEIIIFTHENGRKLSEIDRLKRSDAGSISEMGAHNNILVALDEDDSGFVWDHSTNKRLSTYTYDESVGAIAVGEKVICTGCWEGNLYVRENRKMFDAAIIDLNKSIESTNSIWVVEMTFLSDDVLMVITMRNGILFVSLEKKLCIAHIIPKSIGGNDYNGELTSGAMLNDGRLCIGGGDGNVSAFLLPAELLDRIGLSVVPVSALPDVNSPRVLPVIVSPAVPVSIPIDIPSDSYPVRGDPIDTNRCAYPLGPSSGLAPRGLREDTKYVLVDMARQFSKGWTARLFSGPKWLPRMVTKAMQYIRSARYNLDSSPVFRVSVYSTPRRQTSSLMGTQENSDFPPVHNLPVPFNTKHQPSSSKDTRKQLYYSPAHVPSVSLAPEHQSSASKGPEKHLDLSPALNHPVSSSIKRQSSFSNSFSVITDLRGSFDSIANILDSIRKTRKAKKKIIPLVEDALFSLMNTKKRIEQVSLFVEAGGIEIDTFRSISARITEVEKELVLLDTKLEKMNKIHRVFSSSERLMVLGDIGKKLAVIERDLENVIPLAESRVQTSVLLEALSHKNAPEETKQLLENARQAFGTFGLGSRLDNLFSGNLSNEGINYFVMGKMFFQGLAVEKDYEKSASFFRIAIKCGNSEAYAYLGKQYQGGLGIREDESKAFELYMNGAKLQDPECLYEIGRCFEDGHGVEKDAVKGFEYYTKAANVGHAGGSREVGYCLEAGMGTEVDLVGAAKYYKAAAEAGDEDGLCFFGRSLLTGNGVERNEKSGVGLLKIAASAGSIDALMRLGDCYCYGWGVEKDTAAAFRLYNEAAKRQYLSALGRVGECLLFGRGVVKNKTKGAKSLRKAAAGGSSDALNFLAHLYRNGIEVEMDLTKALVSYERAAAAGNWLADLYLGEMYRNGEGVAVNIEKSIHHFEINAKYGEDAAHLNLGFIYQNEEGYIDENRALYHFRLAADLGNLEARDVVGEYFVSVSGPRKLSFTNDELQVFLGKITAQYARRNKNAPPRLLAPERLDSILPELISNQSAITDKAADIQPAAEKNILYTSFHGKSNSDGHKLTRLREVLMLEQPTVAAGTSKLPQAIEDAGDDDEAHAHDDELKELREIGFNKETVQGKSPMKLAGVMAAYLVGYDGAMGEEFHAMQKLLLKFFKVNLIGGAVLVHAEEEDLREIMDEIVYATCEKSGDEYSAAMRSSIRALLSSFMDIIRKDGSAAALPPSVKRSHSGPGTGDDRRNSDVGEMHQRVRDQGNRRALRAGLFRKQGRLPPRSSFIRHGIRRVASRDSDVHSSSPPNSSRLQRMSSTGRGSV